MIDVYVEVISQGVRLPSYQNPYDAGMDVCAVDDIIIRPGQTLIVPTGLKFSIPEGYEIQVRPRSGISLRTPLRIANSPGTIDAGYRDELGIIVSNTWPEEKNLKACIPGRFNEDDSAYSTEGSSSDSSWGDSTLDEEKLYTLDNKHNEKGSYIIRKGERVAQLILAAVPRMNLIKVDSVKNIGANRGGGFGSTGVGG